jgi:hypothetical protein
MGGLRIPSLPGPAALVILMLLALAWSLPLATRMVTDGDYPDHLRVAASMAADLHIPVPHFLYFAAVAAVLRVIPGIHLATAGIVVTTGFMLAAAAVVWWYVRRTAPALPDAVLAGMTLAVLVAGPVLPPTMVPDVFLIGFFVPNPYHNATITAARPFALALALAGAAALRTGRIGVPWWVTSILVILLALAKPNYLLCLVPAVAIVAAGRLAARRPVHWPGLMAIAATSCVIVWLMRMAYSNQGVEVIVAPFAAIGFHTPLGLTLGLKLLASIVFPITVLVAWPRLIVRHGELALAWVAFAVALLQGYLLAESGPRMDHANLLAGASLAAFVLMVTTGGAALARAADPQPGDAARLMIVGATLMLHVWGGLRHALVPMMSVERWLTPLGYVALLAAGVWLVLTARPRPVRP